MVGKNVRIAILTPTIPGRESLLEEMKASADAQTLKYTEHHIFTDYHMAGQVGLILNDLAAHTDCEWLAPFADDDLMLPHHLERLAERTDAADVVYSRCESQGRGGWQPDYASEICANALIRRSLWEKLGGWSDLKRAEDQEFWARARDNGARFAFVDEVTWIYRFGPWVNKSLVSYHHSFREAHQEALANR